MGSKVVNLLVLGLLMVAAVGSCLTGACFAAGYVHYEYDDAGAVILEQVIDPNGVILQDMRTEYDALGNLSIERMVAFPGCPDNSDDVITVYDHDVAGNLRKVIHKGIGSQDANSVPETNDSVTQYSYDTLGRKITAIDPEDEDVISHYYYSDAGQLLTVVDPYTEEDPNLPFTTTNSYDAAGRLKKTVNPAGHYTVNTYNSLNQIIKQVVWDCNYTPDNPADDVPVRQIRYEYDNLGNVTRQAVMEDPASTAAINTAVDKVVDSIYDTSTGLLDETKTYYGTSATAVTTYEYDDLGRLWRTIDPEGNESRKYFDPLNNVQVVKQERFEKDPADSNNDYTVTVFYDYDLYGNLYRKTLDEDGDGVKDATDPSTYFYYDALDRLVKQIGPDLVATYREYDSFGNVSLTIEDYDPESQTALNKTTEYVYDRLNRQAQVLAYDPNDTTAHIASQITAYEYNKRGQIEKITYPDESFVEYSYNALRKVNTEVRRDGTSIYYWYDLVGNVIIESDDEALEFGSPSFITEYEYNAAGDLVGTYREDDEVPTATSTFAYNGLGLPESESTALYDLDAKTITYTYDGSGNVLTRTHNGQTITYSHDGLGRIKTIDKGQDRIVNYHYIGSSTKVIGFPEADTQWEGYYDTLGRIDRCRSIGPDSETLLDLIYTYDENSNRDSVKYNHLAVPVWDIYTYDNLQRLIQADYGSPTGLASLGDYMGDVRFAAGVASKWLVSDEPFAELAQLQVRDVRQQQRLVYAAIIKAGLDTVVKEYNNGDMPVVTLVEFGEEEAAGQSTYEMIRNDSGGLIGIVITDSNGRITLFTLYPAVGGTLIISISYDASGNEAAKVFSSYDKDGKLTDQVDMLAVERIQKIMAALPASSGSGSKNLRVPSSPSWLDESGDGGGFVMMSMPAAPQTASEQFIYDHLGNRYQAITKQGYLQTLVHNPNNQYTHIHEEYAFGLTNDFYPEHDANGNLQADGDGIEYSYDYRNRLTKIENAGSATIAEYGYDALGRRIKKAAGGKTTFYYYDLFGRVVAEYEKPDSGSEAFARSFVYGNGIDEVLAMFLPEKSYNPGDIQRLAGFANAWLTDDETYDYDESGLVDLHDFAVLAADGASLPATHETRFYYLRDALGSVIGIVGGKFQRESDREFYLYDVYGKPSDASVPSAAGNPYFFTGRRLDTESRLYYYRFRTYDPESGRFLQTDPLGYADSMNLYEYVMSNPTNWIDPLGLATIEGVKTILRRDSEFLNYYTNALQRGISVQFRDKIPANEASWWQRVRYGYKLASPGEIKSGPEYYLNYLDVPMQYEITGNKGCRIMPWNEDEEIACAIKMGIIDKGGAFDDGFQIYDLVLDVKEFDRLTARVMSGDLKGAGISSLKIGSQIAVIAGAACNVVKFGTEAPTLIRFWKGTSRDVYEAFGQGQAAANNFLKGSSLFEQAPNSVMTPRGPALQAATPEAMSALNVAKSGVPVYRQGMIGRQATGDAQFWSFSNPASTPDYANAMGMPPGPSGGYSWMMGGTVRPGAPVITRPAPRIGTNLGGSMEAVVQPGGVEIEWFHIP